METMRKLPSSFELIKYGFLVRLVSESDAEFITMLRSNKKLSKYIHASNGSVDEQIKWIQEYKKRELEGTEYYFIFIKDGSPYGLSRISNIDWLHLTFTSGSWICEPGHPIEDVLITGILYNEIVFDMLKLKVAICDVRKNNKYVLNYHRKILCSYQYGETDLDYLFMSTPETRMKSRLKKYIELN